MPLCQRLARNAWIAIAVGIASAISVGDSDAATRFQGMEVEVVGTGRPVLMIPGLNSGADTWTDTCTALQPQVQCHIVQLPGFAGTPRVDEPAFLAPMRDRLLAYISHAKLKRPDVMGHSLGGGLALQMAIAQPEAVGKLVIVDSLPFFGAVRDPSLTAETIRPMATQMAAGMRAADDATFRKQADAAIQSMVHDPARTTQLKAWGAASDRESTTQAMYELMTTDLRADIARVKAPTLVLGSWAAYKPYGSTLESTRAIFATQYAALPGARIEMSQDGYHFLMWDDPKWLVSQVRGFLHDAK